MAASFGCVVGVAAAVYAWRKVIHRSSRNIVTEYIEGCIHETSSVISPAIDGNTDPDILWFIDRSLPVLAFGKQREVWQTLAHAGRPTIVADFYDGSPRAVVEQARRMFRGTIRETHSRLEKSVLCAAVAEHYNILTGQGESNQTDARKLVDASLSLITRLGPGARPIVCISHAENLWEKEDIRTNMGIGAPLIIEVMDFWVAFRCALTNSNRVFAAARGENRTMAPLSREAEEVLEVIKSHGGVVVVRLAQLLDWRMEDLMKAGLVFYDFDSGELIAT